MADYDTFPKGTDFTGELPEDRADAMEDGALWEYAHVYDVIRADERENENLSEHASQLSEIRKYGHLRGVSPLKYERDDGYSRNAYPVATQDGYLYTKSATDSEPGVVRPGAGLAMGASTGDNPTARIDVQPATASTIGGVKVGDNIAVAADGTISTDVNKAYVDDAIDAEASTRAKADSNLLTGLNKEISDREAADTDLEKKITDSAYTLPAATAKTLGGVKQGNGLVIESDGTARVRGDSGVNVTANGVGLDLDYIASMIDTGGLGKIDASSIATDNTGKLTMDSSLYLTSLGRGAYVISGTEKYVKAVPYLGAADLIGNVTTVGILPGSLVVVSDGTYTKDDNVMAYKVISVLGSIPTSKGTYYSSNFNLNIVIDLYTSAVTGMVYFVPSVRLSSPYETYSWVGGPDSAFMTLKLNSATSASLGVVKPGTSLTVTDDGTLNVASSIFSDGLTATDAQVSVDTGFVGEHLAGDALYYDSEKGLNLKVGTGLEIQNDAVSVDTDALPLASASTRGTVKVGSGLAVSADGTLSATGGTIPDGVITRVAATARGEGLKVTETFYEGWYVSGNKKAFAAYRVRLSLTTTAAFTAGTSISVQLGAPDENTSFTGLAGAAHMIVCPTPAIGTTTFEGAAGLKTLTIPVTADIAAGTAIHVSIL